MAFPLVNRPVFTMTVSPSGNKHSWTMTNSNWSNEYATTQTFNSDVDAQANADTFANAWDVTAKRIEAGTLRCDMIGMLKDQGIIKSRVKLIDAFAEFGAQ